MNYADIQEQFNKVIAYSQGIADPQTDELFAKWYENKKHFINLFNGQLIYEVPGIKRFELDPGEKSKKVGAFIELIDCTYQNEDLAEFILQNGDDAFFENRVKIDWDAPKGKIKAGMKLAKAFKFFTDNKTILYDLQNRASQIIQEDKIEGTLCLSVHPLDFLSSSLNTYNWRSCHALDGEFRSGNLSYMTDATTMICYLKGANDVILPLFPNDVPWNSKKWRVLLFASQDEQMFFAGRQYPFATTGGLNKVWLQLRELFNQLNPSMWSYASSGWSNACVDESTLGAFLEETWVPIDGELHPISELVKDADPEHVLHYNDLLHSSCYTKPYYAFRDRSIWRPKDGLPQFSIGSAVHCLWCGNHYITDPETMMCTECELEHGHTENENYGVCDCCGRRILLEDAWYVNDYEHVCDECYNKYCFTCEDCGNVYYNIEKIFDEETNEYLCSWCNEERKKS